MILYYFPTAQITVNVITVNVYLYMYVHIFDYCFITGLLNKTVSEKNTEVVYAAKLLLI